ncbi:MAG TPA: hypothetical protein VGW14_06565 [Thermoleophilaceae bacterium]|nr:hypothetical protein [Thermoleophilaceae bacterium]
MARLRCSTAIATAAGAAAVLFSAPLPAAAGEREVPDPSRTVVAAGIGHVEDTVFEGSAPRPARIAAARATSRAYTTPDGYRVEIETSPAYRVDPVADQGVADFLGSRLHGPELGTLSVYVGSPVEIRRLCGGGARVVACYSIGESRMYVPGEAVAGIPVEYPLTHEYGHHIASRRSNKPWEALDWGAKHWASAVRVCTYVDRGLLFPGNQGAHYRDDPGEGFADGYAHLHYPDVPWYYNELMRPGPLEFAALRKDVLDPWRGPRSRTFRGGLGPHRTQRTFRLRLKLDGNVTMRMKGAAGASYTVEAETTGYAAGRTLRAGGMFGIEWCRRRPVDHVKLTVRRRTGTGPFALSVRWPG